MTDVTKSDIRAIETQLKTMERKIDALHQLLKRVSQAVQDLEERPR